MYAEEFFAVFRWIVRQAAGLLYSPHSHRIYVTRSLLRRVYQYCFTRGTMQWWENEGIVPCIQESAELLGLTTELFPWASLPSQSLLQTDMPTHHLHRVSGDHFQQQTTIRWKASRQVYRFPRNCILFFSAVCLESREWMCSVTVTSDVILHF